METYSLRNPIKKKKRVKPLYLIVAALLIAIIAVLTVLELTDTTFLLHDRKPATTANAYTKGEPENTAQEKTSDSTPDSKVPTDNNEKSQDTSQKLTAPTGDFVSNHHPNLGGTPAPNTLTSVCTTVAGASCTITFTMGDQEKSLQPQTTDRGGSTYWSWRLQDIGLTEGSWTVQAKATLGSQKQSSTDALKLEVSK